MTDGRGDWTKHRRRVVDQRKFRMPPTWVPRQAEPVLQSRIYRTVYVPGRNRELARRICSLLVNAREMVVLSSFLLADREIEDAILAAAGRKVRVYIMLASEARLDVESDDDEFAKAMREQHRKMLARLGGHVLFRSGPHFHAKFVLADPGGAGAGGLLLTANLTKEALERNEELAVELTREETEEAFALARWAFWEHADHELVNPEDRFRSVGPVGSIEHPEPSSKILATTSRSTQLRIEAGRIVEAASSELVVSSFGWSKDHEIVEFLCVRAREGLAVTALARIRASEMPALLALAKSGARVLGFRWLHAKALCADGNAALVMSANLQSEGLDRGFELGVRLDGDRAREVHSRLDRWSRAARWELSASPVLGDVAGEAFVWRKGRLNEIRVQSEYRVDLGDLVAESADRLDAAPHPALPFAGDMPEPAHDIVYEWRVRAPALAANAKPVLSSFNGKNGNPVIDGPAAFDEPGGRRVVVIGSEQEMDEAVQLAKDAGAVAIVISN